MRAVDEPARSLDAAHTRWRLNRAGIVNVYQYENEVLHFGGGRLLLRGVNGSGKSTAMNMLLPFLLTARFGRIDAAGEQSGMLKSWMLNGRDDPQPVGYLWIEFERRGEFLVCGCGIKASRSSDTVTTWWFLTSKRPGIDFRLVEQKLPLSAEGLRAALGGDQVFNHHQRRDYRAEVERCLFEGAPIDQHIGLINVVRSPRVGDRIGVDLPQHLTDALPQLSEQALADAAQPLDDLEEHRGSVAELDRTLKSVRGLLDVYRAYCVAELRQRVADGNDRINAKEDCSQAEARAQKETAATQAEVSRLGDEISTLDDDARRLANEISALEESQVYREGQDLDALRQLVASLESQQVRAISRVADRTQRVEAAARELVQTRQQSRNDARKLNSELASATELGQRCRITQQPPGPVPLEEAKLAGTDLSQPFAEFDPEEIGRPLAAANGSVLNRRADVEEVETTLADLQTAEHQLSLAESALQLAASASEAASSHLARQHQRLGDARREWDGLARQWAVGIHSHLDEAGISAPAISSLAFSDADIRESTAVDSSSIGPKTTDTGPQADSREAERASLETEAENLVSHWRDAVAAIEQRLVIERAALEDAQAQFDELTARTEPEPPRQDWQTASDHCLADLVDFATHLNDHEQACLEAALHASGLLSARLGDDATVELANGELVALATEGVSHPISEYLTVTVPDRLIGEVDEGLVAKLLDSISCDLSSDAPTVASLNGTFRVGSLRGHHTKQQAEFIGVTARRAALERARREAGDYLAQARVVVSSSEAEKTGHQASLTQARQHLSALPRTDEVVAAAAQVNAASAASDKAESEREAAAKHATEAEGRSVQASNALQQTARTLNLPADRSGLTQVVSELGELQAALERCGALLEALGRSVEAWHQAVTRWQAEINDLEAERAEENAVKTKHSQQRTRLTTLEANIGAEYADVLNARDQCRSKLEGIEARLPPTRDARDQAVRQHADAQAAARVAADRLDGAEQSCEELRRSLAKTLAVPGLRAAIAGPDHPAATPTAPTETGTEGLHQMIKAAERLMAASPTKDDATFFPTPSLQDRDPVSAATPDLAPVTADGVRQSLRQRRDALGAGWDADTRQPDPAQPLFVEVTGPLGKAPLAEAALTVEQQHQRLAGLLSHKQDTALRELLQGLVAREVAEKIRGAQRLVELMNQRLSTVTTAHHVGVRLRWRRSPELDQASARMVELLATLPDLRTDDDEQELRRILSDRLDEARALQPDMPYRQLIADTLDYKKWHELSVMLSRPGSNDVKLGRNTPLSEGEKKLVTYLPLFAAVAASHDALAEQAGSPGSPEAGIARFVLLDDAFAKVSEDNHEALFGLLVELDLDLIATSERLWGTHRTVPELAITEVVRDVALNTILLEHYRWDGDTLELQDTE
ncbi:MAG: TIGR02680 family protein [Acidimicrobiia bacterium]|nr:TIGR02680 family protein [Acidimicrobiia bacterium]MYG58111.1 TIGR02680 family protein [Acidimicrobiia bacterium]MYJ32984.1 TIGR02680 family protein [Acidimicrobiia bacterium]